MRQSRLEEGKGRGWLKRGTGGRAVIGGSPFDATGFLCLALLWRYVGRFLGRYLKLAKAVEKVSKYLAHIEGGL